MTLHVALGIGAGLAAALLFAAVGAQSLPAVMLMYLAPLPILIVSLGWHHLLGLLALSSGAIAVSLALSPSAGLAFALGPALSAWLLAYLALLTRPGTASNDNGLGDERWYPLGHLLLWLGMAGALIGLSSLVAATGGDYERYRSTLEQAAGSLVRREAGVERGAPLPQALGVPGGDFVQLMTGLAPALLGSMLTLVLTINLWLAARVVTISGRLARPWPDVAATRMPMAAVLGLAAAFLLARTEGFAGVAGVALVGGLTMAFAMQGLAVVHWASRGRPGRTALLTIAYGLTFLIGYLFLPAFALLGIADSVLPLRRGLGPRPPSST
ncbi:DUF2232 domain-containing protein [Enterovirga sp.]|uniref:DUF2232 domain-containing protein n=1 Tax=Enterovirga sp. TaxID=2026350 RepID=UPI002CD292E2|nr:DUF2232 domain-containing protein [Enterovirga sp.]HMO28764.1 DUF2232 domain-containing protein [Enterovirga sp.]